LKKELFTLREANTVYNQAIKGSDALDIKGLYKVFNAVENEKPDLIIVHTRETWIRLRSLAMSWPETNGRAAREYDRMYSLIEKKPKKKSERT